MTNSAPAHLISFLNFIAKSFELDVKELRATAKKYDWEAGKPPKPKTRNSRKSLDLSKVMEASIKPGSKADRFGLKGVKPGPKGVKPGPKPKTAEDPLALTAKPLKTRNAVASKEGISSQKITKDGDSITIEPKGGDTIELTLNKQGNFSNDGGVVFVNVPVENPSGRDAMRYVAIGTQKPRGKGKNVGLASVRPVADATEFYNNGFVGLPCLTSTLYKFIKKTNKPMAKLLELYVMTANMIKEAEKMAENEEDEEDEEEDEVEESGNEEDDGVDDDEVANSDEELSESE